MLQAVKWDEGVLSLLDQRLLPGDAKYVTCTDLSRLPKHH